MTDRPTDYATLPVTTGRIYSTYAVLRCGLKKILIYETAVKLYLSTNLHFNGCFAGKHGLPCFPFSSSTCSSREPLGIC